MSKNTSAAFPVSLLSAANIPAKTNCYLKFLQKDKIIPARYWSWNLAEGGKASFQERGVQQKSAFLELTGDFYLLNDLLFFSQFIGNGKKKVFGWSFLRVCLHSGLRETLEKEGQCCMGLSFP